MTAVTASVITTEGTSSSTYTDVTTTTDSVTVDVGARGIVLVSISSRLGSGSSTGINAQVSYDVSGANTISPADSKSIRATTQGFGIAAYGGHFLETGLTEGSTTFKMKYHSSGSTSSNFAYRYITVVPIEDITNLTPAAAYVSTAEGTTSTTYTDLATTTDTVTVDIGNSGMALVFPHTQFSSSSTTATQWCGYDISGATTKAADDDRAIMQTANTSMVQQFGGCFLETGLTPGSTTFKMKYRGSAGTSTFTYRRIAVIPL